MDLDDLPIGRVLTRREVLALLGSSSTLLLLGSSFPRDRSSRAASRRHACVVRPASTQGPYYVDEKLVSSVAKGTLRGAQGRLRTPLEGALVDVWQ